MRGNLDTDAAALMDHLERELGEFSGGGVAAPEWDLPFSVWQFPDRPEPGVTTWVTHGIGAHVLVGADEKERRQELVLILRGAERTAIDLAASVGAYLLEHHVALLVGETVGVPSELGTAVDRLVAAPPTPFGSAFARCEDFEPSLELVWLRPPAVPGADPYELAR